MNIEAEVRSFISKEKFEELLTFFNQNATFIKEDNQETIYFDCKEDIRIQRNDFFSKIWMKKGKLHDDSREEIEVQFKKEDFEKIKNIILSLGHDIEIIWLRKRFEFTWNNITVCLDYTKGYGHIIELEKMCTEETMEKEVENLKKELSKLNIPLTSKEEFNQRFLDYKQNWQTLINSE